jgi:hypothetical protein
LKYLRPDLPELRETNDQFHDQRFDDEYGTKMLEYPEITFDQQNVKIA